MSPFQLKPIGAGVMEGALMFHIESRSAEPGAAAAELDAAVAAKSAGRGCDAGISELEAGVCSSSRMRCCSEAICWKLVESWLLAASASEISTSER